MSTRKGGHFLTMLNGEHIKRKQSFKKAERLKSRDTIVSLFTENRNIRLYPFKIVYLYKPTSTPLTIKVGVSASKRLFKTAVARNALKRRMREAYRLNKHLISDTMDTKTGELSFMIIYTSKELIPFKEYNLRIKQLLIRLANKIEPNLA